MAKARFVRHPSFPSGKTHLTAGGKLWKIKVREWAFAQVNLTDVGAGLTPTSNNPNVVADHRHALASVKGTMKPGTKEMTLRFYALGRGFTFIHLFERDPPDAVSELLQVEVTQRRANKPEQISLTKLGGKTCAVNAPDAVAYEMDTTLLFDGKSTDPAKLFDAVPGGLDHLVISSHGGVLNDADKTNQKKICMFVGGFNLTSVRLELENVKNAFAALKGKIAAAGVIWFGGCDIGANVDFCGAAAAAAGCHVVAPVMPLLDKKFPKGTVDMLDGFAIPKAFGSDGKTISIPDFCAKQDTHKFVVPV